MVSGGRLLVPFMLPVVVLVPLLLSDAAVSGGVKWNGIDVDEP